MKSILYAVTFFKVLRNCGWIIVKHAFQSDRCFLDFFRPLNPLNIQAAIPVLLTVILTANCIIAI